MKPIRVGFIGCGRISDLHYLGYRDREDAKVVAVCDTNEAAAAAKMGEWGAEYSTTDYRRILEDPSIDAVEILTPQKLHESMSIEALERGKHVLVQKPMTISLESADRMIAAAKESGKTFKVMENYIFYPPIMKAKELIEEGRIGEPISMRIKFISGSSGGWDIPEESWAWRLEENVEGRGIQTFDHGFHMWSTAWFFMGEVERVVAWIDSIDNIVDCPATIMWKYKGGKQYGTCDYTHAWELSIPSDYYANDEWFEITGSKGVIKVNRCTGLVQEGPSVSLFTDEGWEHFSDIESDWASGFIGATGNFIDAMQGKRTPMLSGADAREIMKFSFAIQKASKERREVYLDELDAEDPEAYTAERIVEEKVTAGSRKILTLDELRAYQRIL